MIDYARQRQAMVEGQVHVNDVTDPRILTAMGELPREKFVPAARVALAYVDEDIPLRVAAVGKLAPPVYIEPECLLSGVKRT